jgi:hypothetical protein
LLLINSPHSRCSVVDYSDNFFSVQIDARNSRNGEIIFKDNFNSSVAGIVEVCITMFLSAAFIRLACLNAGFKNCIGIDLCLRFSTKEG